MSRSEQTEIERKYDVSSVVGVPRLDGVGPVASTTAEEPVALAAVYFDTVEHLLLANRITLRRREGGHDEGWHAKLPLGVGSRRELHAPLGASADEALPQTLRAALEVVLRGRPVHPVLVLQTKRTITRLLDVDGQQLAELADDEVTATRPDLQVADGASGDGAVADAGVTVAGSSRSWREWELELGPGVARTDGEALFDVVGDTLERAGAEASSSKSKLARGLGTVELPPAVAEVELEPGSAELFVVETLRGLLAELKSADVGVRDGDDDAVSRFGSIVRRMRVLLSVYGTALSLDLAPVESLLATVTAGLSDARHLRVLQRRVAGAAALVPDGFVPAEATLRIDAHLGEALADATRDARRSLDDSSYFELLDRLDALASGAAVPASGLRAKTFVEARLEKEAKRAHKRLRRVLDDRDDAAAFVAAGKAARRLRIAQEAWTSWSGKGASATHRAERLQKAARKARRSRALVTLYVESADRARRADEDTFAYGALATAEWQAAEAAESRFRKVAARF